MKQYLHTILIYVLLIGTLSCTPHEPTKYTDKEVIPTINPDYTNIVIPYNIAPLRFTIEEQGERFLTVIQSHDKSITLRCAGAFVSIPQSKWKCLLAHSIGHDILLTIYIKNNGQWQKYTSFRQSIAPEPIDEYLVYRLIEPSYVTYETMTINERNLTSFQERVLYANRSMSKGEQGQCVNCHAFQDYNRTQHMQMHFRQYQGGTLIMQGDTVKKINLKTKETCSPGVYPAWHPTENLVAYSVNTTGQVFYTKDVQKVEVLDYASDLVLYNPSNESITYIANDSNTFESFPAWNPSGTIVYYAAAHYTQQTDDIDNELAKNYSMLKYNILAKSYNKQSLDFGSADTIFNAAVLGKSATWPRISPDGRYLLFTLGDYGNFHIWHTSSDLYIKDLVTRTVAPLTQINSQQSDSYHTWSSNGRWIVFSSRRDDGNYTRLYMAYFDEKGNAYKPFKLPQAKKNADLDCYQSYNVPEFIINPVQRSKHTMIKALRKDALPVTMNQQ